MKKKDIEKTKKQATRMGFEPTPAERNGLAVHRLNHSATSSVKLKSFSLGFIDTYHVNGSVHIIVLWLTKN